jgi:hypothetical protein
MANISSLKRDIERLHLLLSDAFGGMDATEAAFFDHSKLYARLAAVNFPLEEGLLGETVSLLTAWTGQAAKLVRALDAAMSAERLAFEQLFDKRAGNPSRGVLRDHVPHGKTTPEAMAAELVSLLGVSVELDAMLKQAKPVFSRHHRQCEYYLLQIVERRRTADAGIDIVSRDIAELKARLRRHQGSVSSARTGPALAASEEERKAIVAEQRAARVSEEALLSERETLMRLIEDVEGFVDSLNNQVAAANVIAAKISIDIQQTIALCKAIEAQASRPVSNIPGPVLDAMTEFEASPLSGLGLFERKSNADASFARRLDPVLPPPVTSEGSAATEVAPAEEELSPVEIPR